MLNVYVGPGHKSAITMNKYLFKYTTAISTDAGPMKLWYKTGMICKKDLWSRAVTHYNQIQTYLSLLDHLLAKNLNIISGFYEMAK